MTPIKTFLVQPTGFSISTQARWGDDNACRNCCGMQGTPDEHGSEHFVMTTITVAHDAGAVIAAMAGEFSSSSTLRCSACGAAAPAEIKPDVYVSPLFACDEHGVRQAGEMYFETHMPGKCREWDNCDGRHLVVVMPNGEGYWNIDSRASNCTMREDRTHRCWVRHGDPAKGEPVHVDKNGHTCSAGAGSIIIGGFHGFLHHGELVSC